MELSIKNYEFRKLKRSTDISASEVNSSKKLTGGAQDTGGPCRTAGSTRAHYSSNEPILCQHVAPGGGFPRGSAGARGALSRCPGGPRWQEGARERTGALGAPPKLACSGARGRSRLERLRRCAAQAPEARIGHRFLPVQAPKTLVFHPETNNSTCFFWFCSGLTPSRSVLFRFSLQVGGGGCYRRQGGRLHAGRSVACKEAIRNIPRTSPPINRGNFLLPQHTPTQLRFISPSYPYSSVPLGVLHLVVF